MQLGSAFKKLENFLRQLNVDVDPPKSSLQGFPDILFQSGELGGLMLWNGEATQYRRCLQDIWSVVGLREDVTIGMGEVEAAIQMAILKTLDHQKLSGQADFEKRMDDAFRELKERLEAPPFDWDVVQEVRGFGEDGLPFEFGGFKFYKLQESHARQLTMGDAKAGPFFCAEMLRDLLGKPVAQVAVRAADAEAATRLSLKRLRVATDVLNFYADLQWNRKSYLYLPGEFSFERAHTVRIGLSEPRNTSISSSWVGPHPFYYREHIPGEFGLERASLLLTSSNRSGLEDRILSALQWAGRATIETRKEQGFVLFAIALEVLLLGPRVNVELKHRLSLRGAHLLSPTVLGRKQVKAQLSKLYDKRSEVVHSGSVEVTDVELSQIRLYAKHAIVTILTTRPFLEMKNEAELEAWFDDQLLAGSTPNSSTV